MDPECNYQVSVSNLSLFEQYSMTHLLSAEHGNNAALSPDRNNGATFSEFQELSVTLESNCRFYKNVFLSCEEKGDVARQTM